MFEFIAYAPGISVVTTSDIVEIPANVEISTKNSLKVTILQQFY